MKQSDIIVIIRSVNERTESLCKKLLIHQVKEANIFVVNETPFAASLHKSFEIGLNQNKLWTLCIDADVLINEEVIQNFITTAVSLDKGVFEVQGLIFDKFFSVWKPAGIHLYRTSLLDKAISFIPDEGTSLRPESYVLNKMAEAGYPWVQTDIKVGVHDFEQYYVDIFRKCFLHAHKHSYLIPLLEPLWKEKSVLDKDFEVALMGLRSGKIYGEKVFVDKNFLNEEALEIFHIKGIQEKKNLPNSTSFNFQRIIDNNYMDICQEKIFPKNSWNSIAYNNKTVKKFNPVHSILFRIGHFMEINGRRIKEFIPISHH
ncbi:hypothetical protein BH23BAC1_BH23BAC1_21120 [soil metagenome]